MDIRSLGTAAVVEVYEVLLCHVFRNGIKTLREDESGNGSWDRKAKSVNLRFSLNYKKMTLEGRRKRVLSVHCDENVGARFDKDSM